MTSYCPAPGPVPASPANRDYQPGFTAAMMLKREDSERRHDVRKYLRDVDGIDPDDVVMSPDRAIAKGLTSTVTFPMGNITPEGSVIKSTAIDPAVVDDDGVYRKTGPARVFRLPVTRIRAHETGAATRSR